MQVRLRCGSLSITTPVSLLVNEFDVQGVLHVQVSLAAVNQFCLIHEAMDGCTNLKMNKGLLQKCKYLAILKCAVSLHLFPDYVLEIFKRYFS